MSDAQTGFDRLCVKLETAAVCMVPLLASQHAWRVAGHHEELPCTERVSPVLGTNLVHRARRCSPQVLERGAAPGNGGFGFSLWPHVRLLIFSPRIAIRLNRASEDIVLLQHLQAEAWQKERFSTHLVSYPVLALPSGSFMHSFNKSVLSTDSSPAMVKVPKGAGK